MRSTILLLLAVATSLCAAADWPTMRGPDGSGSADSDCVLLSDPGKVKLLWQSEEQEIPGGYFWPHKDGALGISGGFSGPVVGDGAAIVVYYQPSGEIHDAEGVKKSVERGVDKPRAWLERRWSVNADDVVLCVDAETGKTRWKRRFEQKGLNHSYDASGPLLAPCIADGRVYAMGSAGRVYCLDIDDGNVLWATSDWPGAQHFERTRQACLEKRKMPFFHQNTYSLCSGPAVAGGVVAVNDYCGDWRKQENYGLAGLDAATGKLLWHVTDCMGGVTLPVRWVHEGKEHFIAAAPNRLVCIEAATGAVAWDYRGHVNKLGTPAVSGNYLLCAGTGGKFSPRRDFKEEERQGITCFRMDAKGARKLWSLDPKQSGWWGSSVIYKGHAYVFAANTLLCINVETGAILGSILIKYGGQYSSLVIADGRLVHGTGMYNADPKDFRTLGGLQLGRERVELEVFTTPAIAEGRLYLRAPREGPSHYGRKTGEPGRIYCYDLREARTGDGPED